MFSGSCDVSSYKLIVWAVKSIIPVKLVPLCGFRMNSSLYKNDFVLNPHSGTSLTCVIDITAHTISLYDDTSQEPENIKDILYT